MKEKKVEDEEDGKFRPGEETASASRHLDLEAATGRGSPEDQSEGRFL